VQQGTDEWVEAHRGKVTSSSIDTVLFGTLAARNKLLDKLQFELENPDIRIGFASGGSGPAAQWGVDHEDEAVAQYELKRDVDVVRPGLILHPDVSILGCSPDFINEHDDAAGEVKCPYDPNMHQLTVLYGDGPKRYRSQVQLEIECTGMPVCHFVSYDPRHPNQQDRHLIIVVDRDDGFISEMLEQVYQFQKKLEAGDRFDDLGSSIPSLF